MEISKRNKKQLDFWLKFKNTDKPSFVLYLIYQPLTYSLPLLGLIILYGASFVLSGFNECLTILTLMALCQHVALFIGFRRDWKLKRNLIQWTRVKELANEESNTTT